MKSRLTHRYIAGLSMTMLMLPSLAANAALETDSDEFNEDRRTRKSRTRSSRTNSIVRIYPGLVKRQMHVVAKELDRPIDFFAFDTEGTLVEHFKMNSGDHEKLNNLNRGKYIYRVFSGDLETASGTFEIR